MLTRIPSRSCIFQLLTLFLLLEPAHLSAQDRLLPVFHFHRLRTNDGLPSNEIRSNVVRDRAGFIWVGTVDGLARYDGHSCRVYRHEAGNPYSLSSNSIIRLLVDSKGRLWVGTYASGPSLYDPMRDRFVNFLPRKNDSLWFSGHYVDSFMEEDSGRIWIGLSDGEVVRFDLGAAANQTDPDSIARYLQVRNVGDRRFNGWVTKIVPWDEEHVLTSTGGGLFLVNRRTLNVTRPVLPRVPGIKLDTIPSPHFFYEDTRRLWIGTTLHGLYSLDREKDSLVAYHKGKKDGRIQDLQIDNSGRMWIATGEGVDLFDTSSGLYKDYLPAWEAPGKSSFTQMSLDSSGILWISTMDDGVYYLSPAWFRFPHYGLRGPTGQPGEMSTIDRADDGSFWIGTEGKVARIRLETMQAERMIDVLGGKKPSSGVSSFRTSLVDRKGTLWYGTWGLGLFSFEPRTGSVRNFRFSDQLKDLALHEDVCISLMKRESDSLWVAANNDGLLAFATRTGRFSRVPGVSMAQPWQLITDRNGTIWVADQFSGVYTFDPGSMRWNLFDYGTLSNPVPHGVYEDSGGRIWIGTNAINLWVPETRSFKPIPNRTFENAGPAVPLGSDVRGRLWVRYGDKGLSLLDPNSNLFFNFDFNDGLLYPLDMESLGDGRIMLVGFRGMILVHPDSLFAPGIAPRLLLSRMQINDTTSVPIYGLTSSHMVLQHDQNVLEFGFSAIDPGQGHLIDYSYRLEGLEDAWTNAGDRRYVRYPGLAPGRYVFRVKAASMLARWPDQEISLAISIAPPWWKTVWAYVAYALLFAGALYSAYRLRLRQVRLKQAVQLARLEHERALDRERVRISQDMHDEVGSSLSEISILSELARKDLSRPERADARIREISDRSGEIIENIGEIIWAINPNNDPVDNLISYLRRYAVHYLELAGIRFSFYMPEAVPPLAFSSAVRRDVFLIVKEVLHNVVKHASASLVKIDIRFTDHGMELLIEDNGKGFTPEERIDSGNGLLNMRKRIDEIGGSVAIQSRIGCGTKVFIGVKV